MNIEIGDNISIVLIVCAICGLIAITAVYNPDDKKQADTKPIITKTVTVKGNDTITRIDTVYSSK